MCRRGFVRYIYSEISKHQANLASIILLNSDSRKYAIDSSVSFHLFTTHAPCGDASIFKTLRSTDCNSEDKEPTAKKPKIETAAQEELDDSVGVGDILNGESNFTGAKLIPIDLCARRSNGSKCRQATDETGPRYSYIIDVVQ